MPSSNYLLLGNYDETYGVIYEVIQTKFRASLEPLWAVKVARNSHVYPANTIQVAFHIVQQDKAV